MDYITDKTKLLFGDCLERMKEIPDNSIDCVITDPPYGTTKLLWDSVINLTDLWKELNRITTIHAPIVLFSAQPFTTVLCSSNLENLKYTLVWPDNQKDVDILIKLITEPSIKKQLLQQKNCNIRTMFNKILNKKEVN